MCIAVYFVDDWLKNSFNLTDEENMIVASV